MLEERGKCVTVACYFPDSQDAGAVRRADAVVCFEASVPELVDTYIRHTHSLAPDDCYAVAVILSCRALAEEDGKRDWEAESKPSHTPPSREHQPSSSTDHICTSHRWPHAQAAQQLFPGRRKGKIWSRKRKNVGNFSRPPQQSTRHLQHLSSHVSQLVSLVGSAQQQAAWKQQLQQGLETLSPKHAIQLRCIRALYS